MQEQGTGLYSNVSLCFNTAGHDHLSLTPARKQRKDHGSIGAGDHRLKAERECAIYKRALKAMYRKMAGILEWKGLPPLMGEGEPSIHAILVRLDVLESDDDLAVGGDIYPDNPGMLSMEATEELVLCKTTQNANNANCDANGGKSTHECTLYKPQSNLLTLYPCSQRSCHSQRVPLGWHRFIFGHIVAVKDISSSHKRL